MSEDQQKRQQKNRAVELQRTTSTAGWAMAMSIADDVAKESQQALMECDDESKIVGLQRKAAASREYLETFRRRIQDAINIDFSTPDSQFIEVSTH
jgi:hypothetical protein